MEDLEKTRVLTIGDAVQRETTLRLKELEVEVAATVHELDPGFRAFVHEKKRGDDKPRDDDNFGRYDFYGNYDANTPGNLLANLSETRAWASSHRNPATFTKSKGWSSLAIVTDFQTEILLKFNAIGHRLTGVIAVNPVIFSKSGDEENQLLLGPPDPLAGLPFLFTYAESESAVLDRFRPWLEDQLIRGLDNWRKRIGA